MSKYIKIEDAIRKYAEMIASDIYWEYGVGNGKPDEEDLDMAREYYSDLPTIEVSEDCISREYILGEAFASNEYNRETKSFDLPVVSVRDIENAPSVVPSRAEGGWVVRANGNNECSICGKEKQDGWVNFCGFCGANMKG